MALIRYAEGQQRSGSLGATVYSHNRFGQYVRARSIPVNPNTSRQIAARSRMQSMAGRWSNTLTEGQRQAWEVYAANVGWTNKFGESVNLPGVNHYVRSGCAALEAGLSVVDAAPTNFTLAVPELVLTATGSEASQIISVGFDDTAGWLDEAGGAQIVQVGLPQNAGIGFFGGPYRTLGTILGDAVTPPTTPHAFDAADTPYPFGENAKMWLRSRILRADGRLSAFAQSSFLGAA